MCSCWAGPSRVGGEAAAWRTNAGSAVSSPEHDLALRLTQALQHGAVLGVLGQAWRQRLQHLRKHVHRGHEISGWAAPLCETDMRNHWRAHCKQQREAHLLDCLQELLLVGVPGVHPGDQVLWAACGNRRLIRACAALRNAWRRLRARPLQRVAQRKWPGGSALASLLSRVRHQADAPGYAERRRCCCSPCPGWLPGGTSSGCIGPAHGAGPLVHAPPTRSPSRTRWSRRTQPSQTAQCKGEGEGGEEGRAAGMPAGRTGAWIATPQISLGCTQTCSRATASTPWQCARVMRSACATEVEVLCALRALRHISRYSSVLYNPSCLGCMAGESRLKMQGGRGVSQCK